MSALSNTDTGYADQTTPVDELRAWAQGLYPSEAATEMLIRAGFAQTWRPWIVAYEADVYGIDFARIPEQIGTMSGGESRFLLAAASVGSAHVEVCLGDVVCGIDRYYVELILAGIAHAGGTHEGTPYRYDPDTRRLRFGPSPTSLHGWPTHTEKR